MIGYLDTSVVVPLLVAEDGSAACRRFWDDADDVATCRTTFVETAAALAAAYRADRLGRRAHEQSLALLERMWSEIDVIGLDDALVRRAAALADRCALRGYDAVHCAAAEQLADPDLVAASGDARLLAAWSGLGIATFDPNVRP
ncbi:type II toxin-antitoxin system VapC family toxin [Pseudonocardia sp.]|uniref:type II toxin-antitoxin system VapC family toxin n=1 Tax=Pseudonocardia sp. TaxID=60912 RepID=UPI00261C9442|nr:type II toxin-antitoxin system VapC family toxin [Pseudonocardia sp.]